jgi:hypothetical protein
MKIANILIISVALGSTIACSSVPQNRSACAIADARTVDAFVTEAQYHLGNSRCATSFDDYFDRLIALSRENPGSNNKQAFADLIRSGIAAGAISKRDGMARFNAYFEPEFYSLKTDVRSNCVALSDRQHDMTALDGELRKKRIGLLEIMGDTDQFRQSQQFYQDLTVVMDAVRHSCDAALARR